MTKMRIVSWCAISFIFSGLVCADWYRNGFVIADSEWAESKGDFAAMLLLSDEPNEVLQDWASPGEKFIPVQATRSVGRGVPIVAFVFFAGCMPDEHGLCNASVDVTILKPDGSEYADFPNRDLWRGKPAPPEGTLRLSAEYVGAVIEPADPLGEYRVLVTVHDHNAVSTLKLTKAFVAVEAAQ